MIRFIFQLFQRLLVKKSGAKGILVVQPLPGIGDVIWYLPHLHAIADASEAVSLLTKPRSFADVILKTDSAIKEVIWLERNPGKHSGFFGFFRLIREIRKKSFKQAWVLHGSSRYAWILYLAGVPQTYGYGVSFQRYLFTEADCLLSKQELAVHGIERADTLLAHAAIPRLNKDPKLRFDKLDIKPNEYAKKYKLASQTSKIAFAIGSSVPFKQWGANNFAQLANHIHSLGSVQFILIGGPDEQGLAEEIIKSANLPIDKFVVLAGIPLEEVALLLSLCDACIGNDTGVLNIAAASNTHSIGLFGSTTPLSYSSYLHPVVPEGTVPSSKQQSSVNRMHEITVEQVIRQLQKLVSFNNNE